MSLSVDRIVFMFIQYGIHIGLVSFFVCMCLFIHSHTSFLTTLNHDISAHSMMAAVTVENALSNIVQYDGVFVWTGRDQSHAQTSLSCAFRIGDVVPDYDPSQTIEENRAAIASFLQKSALDYLRSACDDMDWDL